MYKPIGEKMGDCFSRMLLMPFISKTEKEIEATLNKGMIDELRKKGHNIKKLKVEITPIYEGD